MEKVKTVHKVTRQGATVTMETINPLMEKMATLGDGRKMPWVGLGTYPMTEEEAENCCFEAVQHCGYTHIDTA